MPLFDFRCPKCDKVEEHIIRKPDVIIKCKECGVEMKRLVSSNVSFRLYGEGFYNRSKKDTGDFA